MDYRKQFVVDPGHRLCLKDIDPAYKGHHETHETAEAELEHYRQKLGQMQTLLYAERKHGILIVLPPKGWVSIFNRSHYEDVLVTRVHKLIDKATWTARYDRIRDFETELFESQTRILKFFLHISKEEQLSRFEQRLDDPARNWKISESDYSERELWDDYVAAFEDALSATSTHHAPWYVIPSNHKWFRNLAVSQIVADTMEDLGMSFPKPTVDLADIRRKYHAAVEEEKKAH